MKKTKILVVDDEQRMRRLLHDNLVRSGYEVLEAGDGEEALDLFYENEDIAIILLDVMMPRMDGWEVCKRIRVDSQVPIVMLTAMSDEQDELRGFELGVEDYITKPCSSKILLARIDAILRRTGQVADALLEAGGIRIDQSAHICTIDGKQVELSLKEFELLTFFLENKGIALSRDKILYHVWGYDVDPDLDSRTIDTHVKKLRSKMGEKGELIHTIWGLGYKFL